MYELVNNYSSSEVYGVYTDPTVCHQVAEELNLSAYCIRLRTYLNFKLFSEDVKCYEVQSN
jgi:hypothetical protein